MRPCAGLFYSSQLADTLRCFSSLLRRCASLRRNAQGPAAHRQRGQHFPAAQQFPSSAPSAAFPPYSQSSQSASLRTPLTMRRVPPSSSLSAAARAVQSSCRSSARTRPCVACFLQPTQGEDTAVEVCIWTQSPLHAIQPAVVPDAYLPLVVGPAQYKCRHMLNTPWVRPPLAHGVLQGDPVVAASLSACTHAFLAHARTLAPELLLPRTGHG